MININVYKLRKQWYTKEEKSEIEKHLGIFAVSSYEEYRKGAGYNMLVWGAYQSMEEVKALQGLPYYEKEAHDEWVRENERLEYLEEGREEGIQLTAKSMLKEKIDIELISKVTGLSKKELLKLQKEIN